LNETGLPFFDLSGDKGSSLCPCNTTASHFSFAMLARKSHLELAVFKK
jgi:hypothetical protein